MATLFSYMATLHTYMTTIGPYMTTLDHDMATLDRGGRGVIKLLNMADKGGRGGPDPQKYG